MESAMFKARVVYGVREKLEVEAMNLNYFPKAAELPDL